MFDYARIRTVVVMVLPSTVEETVASPGVVRCVNKDVAFPFVKLSVFNGSFIGFEICIT